MTAADLRPTDFATLPALIRAHAAGRPDKLAPADGCNIIYSSGTTLVSVPTQRLSALYRAEDLPRSAIGKVLKRDLRDRLAAGEFA